MSTKIMFLLHIFKSTRGIYVKYSLKRGYRRRSVKPGLSERCALPVDKRFILHSDFSFIPNRWDMEYTVSPVRVVYVLGEELPAVSPFSSM